MNNKTGKILFFLVLALFLNACQSNVFQQVIDLENQTLTAEEVITFEFDIAEEGTYDIFYIFRNGLNYPFYNFYFKSKLSSEKTIIYDGLQEVDFFHDKTGKPYGKGLGGAFEHEFRAFKQVKLEEGSHTIALKQYMRENNLEGLLSIGIIVRKAE